MSAETNNVPLYRIENPNITAAPDGVVSHEDLVGQWFTPSLDTATVYLRKSTQTFGRDAHPVEGAQLVIAKIPPERLDSLHVSQHPVASSMDVEGDNYIVPRDGEFGTSTIPLDEALTGLVGKLGKMDKLKEAKERVKQLVVYAGELTIS